MTYKVYKNKYPAYLEDCVQPYRSIYNTRHSEPTRHMLTIPHYDYKRHKKVWNYDAADFDEFREKL